MLFGNSENKYLLKCGRSQTGETYSLPMQAKEYSTQLGPYSSDDALVPSRARALAAMILIK